jgi:hypothetical protein
LGRSLALVQFVRREEKATLLVDAGPTVCEPRRQGPRNMVDELVGLCPQAWSPALSIVGRGADGTVVEKRGLQASCKTGERLLGIRCTGKRGPTQRLDGADLLGTVLAPLLIDGALGLRLALVRVEEAPALLDAPIARAYHVIALALRERRHRLGSDLGQDGLGCAQGRGDAGNPLAAGIGQLLQILCPIERTSGPQVGGARGRAPLGNGLADDLAAVCRITAVATEGVHQHGKAGRVLNNEVEHDLVEVRAMIPAVALGDVDDLLVGRRRAVIPAINMETGTIEMGKGRSEPSPLRRRCGHQTLQGGDAKVIERIEGTPQCVIVQMAGVYRRSDEPRGRLILEKVGPQVQLLVHKAKPVEDHRLDRMAGGHETHCRVWLGRFINDFSHAAFVKHACAKAQVI